MDIIDFLEDFFLVRNNDISVISFIFNLLITACMGYILGVFFRRYGQSLSNRSYFGANFVLLAATTMLIITVVKSSLALSLGLVGALSIVRFRSAIKEPEELVYLFLTISVGLGMGAEQQLLTIIGYSLALIIIYLRSLGRENEKKQNLMLTFDSAPENSVDVEKITNILQKHCISVELRRVDLHDEILETMFMVNFKSHHELNLGLSQINATFKTKRILFVAV